MTSIHYEDEVGESPCDTCKQQQRCENNFVACRTFDVWVNTGKTLPNSIRRPNRRIFKSIFPGFTGHVGRGCLFD